MCAVPGNCFSFSQELLLLVISLSLPLSPFSAFTEDTSRNVSSSKNHSHFPVSEFYFSLCLQSFPAGQTNREKVNCSHCFSSSLRDKAKILYSILCFDTIFFIRTHQELFCYLYHVRFCADWALQI